MFGDDYFEARARLADLATRVVELAEKTGADKGPLEGEDVVHGMVSPYLFVACGETGAGKSSMLNGIFGHDVCSAEGSEGTDSVQWYRYGEKHRDQEVTPEMEQRYRPFEFLKRFNLMDTPGTDLPRGGQESITQRFIPSCDVVFWVVPAGTPWGASLWDSISRQDQTILKKSVIVLQQKELLDEGELEIIQGHVRDLARQRLSYVPPIFSVSAKQACQAKAVVPVDEPLWRKSGYPNLEQFISDAVAHSPARNRMLIDIRKATTQVLRHIETAVEKRRSQLDGNEHFLLKLEAEVDVARKKQSADFLSRFAGMREVFAGKNKEMKRYVRRKLGFWSTLKSLFMAENTSKVIETWLVDSIKSSVETQADADGARLIKGCHRHWDTVRPRVKEKLSIKLDDFDDERDGFDKIREEFVARMGAVARRSVQNLRLRKALNSQIVVRREGLKNWLYLCLTTLMLAGVVGVLGVGPGIYIELGLLSLCMISLLGFAMQVRLTGRKITKSLGTRLEHARLPFAQALESDHRVGVRCFYSEYADLLNSVRHHIFDAQQALAPNLEERNRLFLELMIIEREM